MTKKLTPQVYQINLHNKYCFETVLKLIFATFTLQNKIIHWNMKLNIRVLLLALFGMVFLNLNLFGQQGITKKIKIYGNHNELQNLMKKGVCLDHGDSKPGHWFTSYFSEWETAIIRQSGLKFDVLLEDASKQQLENKSNNNSKSAGFGICNLVGSPEYPVPTHFKQGSMNGFYTYQELLDDLDSMALLYPNLITVKASIDSTNQTWEGRPIFFVKLSDNPNFDETEPEVYYSAVHHAREPGSMQQLVYYMWYLLENYNQDSLVTAIVNNRELFFVPCLNPDGYLYNELTNPGGFGYWRKNRRDNLDGTFGVDLNRNYDMFWGFDDFGSSPITSSEVYRGTSPGSEPEISMAKNFINGRNFKTAMDNHTFGNYLLYPWGHVPDLYTPDSAYYEALANLFTEYNDYAYGTVNQTLNYVSNGGSFDWLYGEQVSKPKIFDFTPEFGYDFWPDPTDIVPIIQDAMYNNFMVALVAGSYANADDVSEKYIASSSGFINYNFIQLGLDTVANYTVLLTPISTTINSTGAPKVYSNLNFFQTLTDSISFSLNTPIANGTEIRFLLTVDFGSYQISDTLVKYYGNPAFVLSDDGSSTANWNTGIGWNTTTEKFRSPPTSITDSPFSNYPTGTTNELVLTNSINLGSALKAGLNFYTRWRIESKYDFAEVFASNNNGITWTPLCGKYSRPGNTFQDFNQPIYDGTQNSWVKEEMSLNDFIGSNNVKLKFVLASDNFEEFDGIYIDDLNVWAISTGVGVEDVASSNFSGIYPNPTTGNIKVNYEIPAEKQATIQVTNSLGENFDEIIVPKNSQNIAIDLSNLANGIYFLQLKVDKIIFDTHRITIIK
jgi:hypothetical protein